MTDYQDMVFAGTTLLTGVARGVAISAGEGSQFGHIVAISSKIAGSCESVADGY